MLLRVGRHYFVICGLNAYMVQSRIVICGLNAYMVQSRMLRWCLCPSLSLSLSLSLTFLFGWIYGMDWWISFRTDSLICSFPSSVPVFRRFWKMLGARFPKVGFLKLSTIRPSLRSCLFFFFLPSGRLFGNMCILG